MNYVNIKIAVNLFKGTYIINSFMVKLLAPSLQVNQLLLNNPFLYFWILKDRQDHILFPLYTNLLLYKITIIMSNNIPNLVKYSL